MIFADPKQQEYFHELISSWKHNDVGGGAREGEMI